MKKIAELNEKIEELEKKLEKLKVFEVSGKAMRALPDVPRAERFAFLLHALDQLKRERD